jgi:tetratricopeptide (TPR) repeat protein
MVAAAYWMLASLSTSALAQQAPSACGPIGAGSVTIGPYDYRTDRKEVDFINGNHFQPQVQALIGGVSGPIGGELDFILRHIPNHHQALVLLMKYGEKLKWAPAPGMHYPYECYYERAIRWRSDDAIVHLIYATYLNKFSRTQEALAQVAHAIALDEPNGFTQYNAGLIYLEMKQYDLALAQAHKAEALGFTRSALRNGLMKAGKWKEPLGRTDAPAASSAAPAAASASSPKPAATSGGR